MPLQKIIPGLLAEHEVLQLEVGDFTPKIFKGSLKDYQGLEGVRKAINEYDTLL